MPESFRTQGLTISTAHVTPLESHIGVSQNKGHPSCYEVTRSSKYSDNLIYTQLINFESDEFHVRAAENLKEDKELVEAGFEFVTEREGVKIYRKRKWKA